MRLVMMGTGTFAEPAFEAILAGPNPVVGLVTQPDRVAGAERGSTRQTGKGMKNIALTHSIPTYQPESINTPAGMASLLELTPDLLVVAAYGQILSRDVLAIPKHGGINVHASLLPKYRGAAPIAWAIAQGETRTGVTIIRMSPYLDAGEMLAQEALEIGPDETAGELEARLAPLGAKMAVQVIEQIAAGTAQAIPQDKSQATKAPKLTKEHGLIDWSRSVVEVCNRIRAMQPWPTAYTFLHRAGEKPLRLIINRARPAGVAVFGMGPGGQAPGDLVVRAGTPPQLVVVAGAGADDVAGIEIVELQPAGKRKMSATDFLRGNPIQAGARFGPETP